MCKADRFQFGENGFDVIRVVSAYLIIIGHTTMHLNLKYIPVVSTLSSMWPGLFALFAISGYLIPASYERSKNNIDYLKKRLLRLYPGLIAAFILSFICVIFIGGGYSLRYTFADIVKWVVAQLTVFQFYTPASIEAYGVGNPNGTLWTISMEIQIYFVIMLFWNWLRNKSSKFWLVIITLSVMVNIMFDQMYDMSPAIVAKLINVTFIPYLYLFLIGMYAYAKKEVIIPLLIKVAPFLCCIYIFWFVVNSNLIHMPLGHYRDFITGIMVCLITLGLGYRVGKIRLRFEISYGLYIYHMIVINLMVVTGLRTETVMDVVIVLLITTIFAVLSNKLIEMPAMKKLKK